tara:strand:- start:37102 stop:37875 length:774 start_codon:yes stop_codon:yes gene_type:complete
VLKKSYTQVGFLKLLENIVRCHPLIYLLSRNISKYLRIFEADAAGLKKIDFQEKINCIDVGASDGIFINYINKFLSINKAICFEPNKNYILELKKINKINLVINEYGLGLTERIEKIYVPYYKFFNWKFYLDAYSFPSYKNCDKQINLDFFFKKSISIEEREIVISNKVNLEEKINLIKIDINGNELEIIKTLEEIIKRDKPIIYIENNFDTEEIIKILSIYEYKPYVYDLNKNNFLPFTNQQVLNIYFKNNQFKFI